MNKIALLSILIGTLAAALFFGLFSNHFNESLEHKHAETKKVNYTCPMHPQIKQDYPGRCPICHMELVQVSLEPEVIRGADQDSEVDLKVSPNQVRLAGIHPIKVTEKIVYLEIPVAGRMQSQSTVVFQIFESDLRYVKRGESFEGHSEVFPGNKLYGKIISVDSIADPTSRTIRAVGVIEKGPSQIPIEGSFNGVIKVNLGKQLIVPEKSVLFTGRGSYVYLYQNDSLKPQKVTVGPKFDEKFVITDGVELGDNISSGPNFLVDSESKIRGLNDQSHH